MSLKPLLLLALGVGACSSGPSDPPALGEPEGTAIIVDNQQLVLRDVGDGSQRLLPGPWSIVARVFDEDRMVRGRWQSEGVGPGLEMVTLANGQVEPLADVGIVGANILALSVRPDRSSITFVVRSALLEHDASTIHSLDLATGQVSLLWPEAIRQIVELEWLPDGRRLLAQIYDGLEANIVMFDFRGATPSLDTIKAASSRLPAGVSLSPDGRELVFTRWMERNVLHVLDLTRPDQVKNLGVIGFAPRFDPHGDWVMYSAEQGIRVHRLADGEDRPLPGNPTGIPVGWL